MKLEEYQIEEIKQGYQETEDCYHCIWCGKQFLKQEVFSINQRFFTAQAALQQHLHLEHPNRLSLMLKDSSRYNTLTQNQKELLLAFAQGKSDQEIALEHHISASTVRHQKFMFREKYKQAKFYLTVFESVFASPQSLHLMDIPEHTSFVDDRFVISEEEREEILQKRFVSLDPLKLSSFPIKKEKMKIVILTKLCELFEPERTYTEAEVNAILKEVYDDYVTLRRYLIEYRFFQRNKDGSAYWMTK